MRPPRPLSKRDRAAAAAVLLGLGGLAAAASLPPRSPSAPAPLVVNESPSLPRGLYLRIPSAPPRTRAVVAIRQPASLRTYLSGLGVPGEVRLLKRVAACAGADVCAGPGHVRVGDRRVPVLARDRRGVALPAWRECRKLRTGELFLLGDTPTSFDSRYFGPVRSRDVDGVYREVLRW